MHRFKKVENWHFSKGVSPWLWSKTGIVVLVQFFSKVVRNRVICDLLDRKLANLDQKHFDFKNQKISIFPQGLVYGFWSKIGKCFSVQFFSKIVQNKVFFGPCKQKSSHLRLQNMNLKKSKILHFPKVHNFWSKIGNFVPVQFFSKIVRSKVFFDLLDRKLANLDQKNIDFKKQKTGIFPQGLVYGFWSKIGNFVPVQFFSKILQNKVFCEPIDRNIAI